MGIMWSIYTVAASYNLTPTPRSPGSVKRIGLVSSQPSYPQLYPVALSKPKTILLPCCVRFF